MDIKEEEYRCLIDGVKLPRNARVLVSWPERRLAGILKRAVPDISIEYLMEKDLDAFIRQKIYDDDGCYDFIFDNGLLADMRMDGVLLRSLGMHLKFSGGMRVILPSSFDRNLAGECAYKNNFEGGFFINMHEAGAASFYVAEFSFFQKIVTWLQSFYTPELRRELSFLLQRIDFDVQSEESIRDLRFLVQRYDIDAVYIRFFVDTAVIHKEKLHQLLW